jgi:hypothetical protein
VEAQVALTLRTLGGLNTPEIAGQTEDPGRRDPLSRPSPRGACREAPGCSRRPLPRLQ